MRRFAAFFSACLVCCLSLSACAAAGSPNYTTDADYGCRLKITERFWDGFNLYEEYQDYTYEYTLYKPGAITVPPDSEGGFTITVTKIDQFGIELKTSEPMSPGYTIILGSDQTVFTLYREHTLHLATPYPDSGYSYEIVLEEVRERRLLEADESGG